MADELYKRLGCAGCGVPTRFFKSGNAAKFCSDAKCKDSHKVAAAVERHEREGRVVECADCGLAFCPLYGSSHSIRCRPCAEYKPLKRLAPVTHWSKMPKIKCRSCSGFFSPAKGKLFCSRACFVLEKQRQQQTCLGCGSSFVPKKAIHAKYCGRQCAFVHAKQWIKHAVREKTLKAPKAININTCKCCLKELTGRKSAYCSDACCKAFNADLSRQRSERLHNQDGKVVQCEKCNCSFCPVYGHARSVLCSVCSVLRARAAHAARNAVRRARERGRKAESVVPASVFERDGWLCKLCGVATPMRLRGTYEHNAPELDHVIPLSRGGEHTYANTQCLCRSCNGFKSSMTMSETLEALSA